MAARVLREALNDDGRWLAFPYRELLWKLGMTRTVVETDWRGDFLISVLRARFDSAIHARV